MKKEILNVIDFDITEANSIGISDLSYHLQNKGFINFTIEYRENQFESWLQCEYWSDKISKTIIVDYDFRDRFKSIDDFILSLKYVEKEIIRIKKTISN